jgi:hypothetical protein
MKKLLTTVALLGVASLAFGQGEVNFQNGTTSRIVTNSAVGGGSTGSTFSSVVSPNAYYYVLFAAPNSVTSVNGTATAFSGTAGNNYVWFDTAWSIASYNNSGTIVYGYATNTSLGRLAGINATADSGVYVQYPQLAYASFVIVGWSAAIGSTIGQVETWYNSGSPASIGWIGESAVSGQNIQVLGDGSGAPGTILSGAAGFIGPFMMGEVPVPEPSTFALAGLGAAALLIFRRRK